MLLRRDPQLQTALVGVYGIGIGPALLLFANARAKQTEPSQRLQPGVHLHGVLVDIVQMTSWLWNAEADMDRKMYCKQLCCKRRLNCSFCMIFSEFITFFFFKQKNTSLAIRLLPIPVEKQNANAVPRKQWSSQLHLSMVGRCGCYMCPGLER